MFSKRQKAVRMRRQYQDGARLKKTENDSEAIIITIREFGAIFKEHMENTAGIETDLLNRVEALEAKS